MRKFDIVKTESYHREGGDVSGNGEGITSQRDSTRSVVGAYIDIVKMGLIIWKGGCVCIWNLTSGNGGGDNLSKGHRK